jgi:hypothetical protein
MNLLSKSAAAWTIASVFAIAQALASEPNAAIELNKIALETSALNDQKSQVLQIYQSDAKACWQKFAVNDCLSKARRDKYQRLAPIEQLEIILNAKRRELKETDRIQRLNEKSKSEVVPLNSTKASP